MPVGMSSRFDGLYQGAGILSRNADANKDSDQPDGASDSEIACLQAPVCPVQGQGDYSGEDAHADHAADAEQNDIKNGIGRCIEADCRHHQD